MEMQLTEPQKPAIGSSVKLVIGMFVVALGVVLTLDNLDYLDAGRVLRYWPVVLIAIGLLKFPDRASRTLAIAAIAGGTILLALNARWLSFSIGRLWPVFLIGAGIVIVVRSLGFALPQRDSTSGGDIWAVLSTRKFAVTARELGNRRVVAFMGGAVLEITDDGTGGPREPVVLDVFAMWGGIHIRVPAGWEVVGETIPVMGGVDIKTRGARGGRLIVRGLVLMAGMEIKSMEARTQ